VLRQWATACNRTARWHADTPFNPCNLFTLLQRWPNTHHGGWAVPHTNTQASLTEIHRQAYASQLTHKATGPYATEHRRKQRQAAITTRPHRPPPEFVLSATFLKSPPKPSMQFWLAGLGHGPFQWHAARHAELQLLRQATHKRCVVSSDGWRPQLCYTTLCCMAILVDQKDRGK